MVANGRVAVLIYRRKPILEISLAPFKLLAPMCHQIMPLFDISVGPIESAKMFSLLFKEQLLAPSVLIMPRTAILLAPQQSSE